MFLTSFLSTFIFVSLIDCEIPQRRIVSSHRNRFYSADLRNEEQPWVWGDSTSNSHTERPQRDPNRSRLRYRPHRPSILRSREKQCGESPLVKLGGRIVGGREALVGEFPWQAAMLQKGLNDYEYQCGAAILKEQWIITASHCLEDVKPENLKIAVGIHYVNNIKDADKYDVDKIIRHENYHTGKGGELINDIALLHLSRPIDLKSSDLINSVCLPEQGQIFTRNVEVSGWGRTHEYGLESKELRTVEVFVKSNDVCNTNLNGLFRPKEMLCAAVNKGGKDACTGDSGGPLVKRDRNTRRATIIGLVSYGIGCARKGKPGVYTRVSNYVNWINKHMQ